MLEAHGELERQRGLLDEAAAAREELLDKIASPAIPTPRPRADLASELNGIAELARTGAWRQARRALDEFNPGRGSGGAGRGRATTAGRRCGPATSCARCSRPTRSRPGGWAAAKIPASPRCSARRRRSLHRADRPRAGRAARPPVSAGADPDPITREVTP